MADKNIQMKIKNGGAWDNLFPKTKPGLVEGLTALLDVKVDKVAGKELSTNDYTTTEKTKLSGIADNANNYVHPSGAGNNHLPTGGTVGNVLKNSASGVGAWAALAAADIPTLALAKISDAGTAASKNVGTASGNVPILDANGKLDSAVVPAIAISDTFVVATQAAMLALTVEVGDIAVRTDLNKSFILKTAGAATLANWQELLTPASAVQSVAGKTGVVTLTSADVGLGNVTNESKATMFANPVLTGNVPLPVGTTVVTQASTDSSTKPASTAYVKSVVASISTGAIITVSATDPGTGDFWYQEI